MKTRWYLFLPLLSIFLIGCSQKADIDVLYPGEGEYFNLHIINEITSAESTTKLRHGTYFLIEIDKSLVDTEHYRPASYVDDYFYSYGEEYSTYFTFDFTMPNRDTSILIKNESRHYVYQLFDWSSNLMENPEQIDEIRIESGAVGVASGNLTSIKYSRDENDKNNILEFLHSEIEIIPSAEGIVSGGSYEQLALICADGTQYININNGHIFNNDCYYELSFQPSILYPYLSCHSFITYSFDNGYEIYQDDEKISSVDSGLGEIEFIEYSGDIDFKLSTTYLNCDFGRLYLFEDGLTFHLFYYESGNELYDYGYFTIVKGADFSYLFN